MLRKRILAATVMAAFCAAVILFDWRMHCLGKDYIPGILLLVLIATALGCRDFYNLAAGGDVAPAKWLGTIMAVLTAVVIWLMRVGPMIARSGEMNSKTIEWLSKAAGNPGAVALCLGVAITIFFARRMTRSSPTGTLVSVAVTLGGVVYVGVLNSFVTLIGSMPQGPLQVATFLIVVKGSDIGAYFVGRWFGRHKMIPWVSPKKTWEGFCGALAMGMLLAYVLGEIWTVVADGAAMAVWQRLVFGFTIAAIGHFGDLCESLIKRDMQKKDSGADVPGFGGVLDVIDSPLIAGPFAYLLLVIFRGVG